MILRILFVFIAHQLVATDEASQKQLVSQLVKRENISDRIADVM